MTKDRCKSIQERWSAMSKYDVDMALGTHVDNECMNAE